jgi:hypothetical protein
MKKIGAARQLKGLQRQAMFLIDQLPGGSQSLEDMAVAALDVITAFAVPSLNTSFRESLIFSGSVACQVAPAAAGHSVYFGIHDLEERTLFDRRHPQFSNTSCRMK